MTECLIAFLFLFFSYVVIYRGSYWLQETELLRLESDQKRMELGMIRKKTRLGYKWIYPDVYK